MITGTKGHINHLGAIATVIVLVLTVVAGIRPASAKAQTLQPTSTDSYATLCDPPPNPGRLVHRCAPQAWGIAKAIGVDIVAGADTPRPYALTARATLASVARHELAARAKWVTYAWTFRVGASSTAPGDAYARANGGAAYAWVDLDVSHPGCSTCTAAKRTVILGTDPASGTSGPEWRPMNSTLSLSITMTNSSGGPIPAGPLTVRARLGGSVEFIPSPTWTGFSQVHVPLSVYALTADSAGWSAPAASGGKTTTTTTAPTTTTTPSSRQATLLDVAPPATAHRVSPASDVGTRDWRVASALSRPGRCWSCSYSLGGL